MNSTNTVGTTTNTSSSNKEDGEEKDGSGSTLIKVTPPHNNSTIATTTPANNNNNILLLDGGMGHTLRQMGHIDIRGQVGSMQRFVNVALANINHYNLVVDAHLAFIKAGADIITTNTYAAVPRVVDLINNSNNNDDDSSSTITLEDLLVAGCRAACEARDKSGRRNDDVLVAGCLPPLAESYRPDLVGDYAQNLETYRRIVRTIAPYCDVMLCETMSTALEAKAACQAAAMETTNLPVWVSWTLNETEPVLLRSGETLQEAVNAISDIEPSQAVVQAYLVNCTSPESVTAAMPILSSLIIRDDDNNNSIRIGGYPNGFVTATTGEGKYRDLDPTEYYRDFVSKWIHDDNNSSSKSGGGSGGGATIVGGCCGIFPKHIAYIRKRLDERRDNRQDEEENIKH